MRDDCHLCVTHTAIHTVDLVCYIHFSDDKILNIVLSPRYHKYCEIIGNMTSNRTWIRNL